MYTVLCLYYFWGFYVYISVDFYKACVLTLVGEIPSYQLLPFATCNQKCHFRCSLGSITTKKHTLFFWAKHLVTWDAHMRHLSPSIKGASPARMTDVLRDNSALFSLSLLLHWGQGIQSYATCCLGIFPTLVAQALKKHCDKTWHCFLANLLRAPFGCCFHHWALQRTPSHWLHPRYPSEDWLFLLWGTWLSHRRYTSWVPGQGAPGSWADGRPGWAFHCVVCTQGGAGSASGPGSTTAAIRRSLRLAASPSVSATLGCHLHPTADLKPKQLLVNHMQVCTAGTMKSNSHHRH